jgi:hypothetical protein
MIPYVRRKKILAELGKKEIVYISDLEKTLPDLRLRWWESKSEVRAN